MQAATDGNARLGRSKQREKWLLVGGVAVAIAAVSLAAWLALMQLRESATARVAIGTQNLVASLNQTMDGLFDSIDIALLASADEIGRQRQLNMFDVGAELLGQCGETWQVEIDGQRAKGTQRAQDQQGSQVHE